jgi:hypothetical protein
MVGRKAALAVVSVVLLLSMGGGFLLLPLLIPAHVWAARRSGPIGRVLWSALPVAAAGMVVWALVYVSVGESRPAIWLLPALACVVAVVAVASASRPVEPSVPW